MDIAADDLIIKGVTTGGRRFRPSDWAERLSGVMSEFGRDNRLSYSPYVRPLVLDGLPCVLVSKKLQEIDPRAWRFVVGFAHDNELVMVEGSVWRAAQAAAKPGHQAA